MGGTPCTLIFPPSFFNKDQPIEGGYSSQIVEKYLRKQGDGDEKSVRESGSVEFSSKYSGRRIKSRDENYHRKKYDQTEAFFDEFAGRLAPKIKNHRD